MWHKDICNSPRGDDQTSKRGWSEEEKIVTSIYMDKISMAILEREETKSAKSSTSTNGHLQRARKWNTVQLKNKHTTGDMEAYHLQEQWSWGSHKSRQGKRPLSPADPNGEMTESIYTRTTVCSKH